MKFEDESERELWEYYFGKCIQGLLSSNSNSSNKSKVKQAFNIAELMIIERKKNEQDNEN